jgi:hypothetical protein
MGAASAAVAAAVSTAVVRPCALRNLGGLVMQLSAVLALCPPPGESVSIMRGAAESGMSNVVRPGGGGWLAVMTVTHAVSGGCWSLLGRSAVVIMHFALCSGPKCVLCWLLKWIVVGRACELSV